MNGAKDEQIIGEQRKNHVIWKANAGRTKIWVEVVSHEFKINYEHECPQMEWAILNPEIAKIHSFIDIKKNKKKENKENVSEISSVCKYCKKSISKRA